MTGDALSSFLEATVRTATPLLFAALGETVSERAGVINIGLEGSIICGAFASIAIAGAAHLGIGMGFAGGVMAGALMATILAVFVLVVRSDQIITGTAVTLLGLGLTGTLYRVVYGSGGAALDVPTFPAVDLPLLSSLPFVGRALFAQPLPTYMVAGLVPLVWWWLYRTHSGLSLRATGESPAAATAAGVRVRNVRAGAMLVGGAMGGAAGATLVLAQAGTFAEGMSAGRGFIAIAIVVLGRWRPLGVVLAALLFGAASALQYLFQAMGWALPYQIFLALPYLLTLLALATATGRARPPAALGARLDDA